MRHKTRLDRIEQRLGEGSGESPVVFFVVAPDAEVPGWAIEMVRPLLERDGGDRGGVLMVEWHRDTQGGGLAASWSAADVKRWYQVAPDGATPMDPPTPVTFNLDNPQGFGDE